MSKPFFDVFPKLKVRKDLQDYFQDTQVERLATNRERTRLKVCLRSDHLKWKCIWRSIMIFRPSTRLSP